jgi:hypothetical protein
MDGVLQEDVDYYFTIEIASPIPKGGYIALTVPDEIGIPDDPSTEMSFTCTFCATESEGTIDWDSSSRELKFKDLLLEDTDYMYEDSIMTFEVSGWTNPATTSPVSLIWSSYAIIEVDGSE